MMPRGGGRGTDGLSQSSLFCFRHGNNPPSLQVPQSRSEAEVCSVAGEADG